MKFLLARFRRLLPDTLDDTNMKFGFLDEIELKRRKRESEFVGNVSIRLMNNLLNKRKIEHDHKFCHKQRQLFKIL
jgi:hypothetical protein